MYTATYYHNITESFMNYSEPIYHNITDTFIRHLTSIYTQIQTSKISNHDVIAASSILFFLILVIFKRKTKAPRYAYETRSVTRNRNAKVFSDAIKHEQQKVINDKIRSRLEHADNKTFFDNHIKELVDQHIRARIQARMKRMYAKLNTIKKLVEENSTEIEVVRAQVEEISADVYESEEEITTTKTNRGSLGDIFEEGQRIRHVGNTDTTWVGLYDPIEDGILHDDVLYPSLNKFAKAHYRIARPDRSDSVNSWKECEYEVDGEWISTINLRS